MTTRPQTTGGDAGFSIVEVVVASALLLLVAAAMLDLANPLMDAAVSQPEAADLQQRARAAAISMFRDLHVAGAGPDRGAVSGPLGRYFAAVLPRRIGAEAPDAPAVARSDVVSIIWVPVTNVQATLAAPFSASSMTLGSEPGCPPARPACGATVGMGIALFDRAGYFDLFTVEAVDPSGVTVRARGASSSHAYADTARVVEVEARTYYVDTVAGQLRMYDTDRTDSPVMDDVVSMTVEYFGTAAPPSFPKPAIGEANCLYDGGGGRLPGMSVLAPGEDGLAPLPTALFTDGPWCGAGSTMYDADLLRVRRVRIVLRLQVSSPALRGAGDQFANAGIARTAARLVPDVAVSFDVSLRNVEGVE